MNYTKVKEEETSKIIEPKIFNYYEDITIILDEFSYKVSELLAMEEHEFSQVYISYEKSVQNKLQNIQDNANKTGILEVTGLIDMMERVRIERRIIKLEKYNFS